MLGASCAYTVVNAQAASSSAQCASSYAYTQAALSSARCRCCAGSARAQAARVAVLVVNAQAGSPRAAVRSASCERTSSPKQQCAVLIVKPQAAPSSPKQQCAVLVVNLHKQSQAAVCGASCGSTQVALSGVRYY